MASQKVQGINIKLSADTTAVGQALSDLNKKLNSTQKELNQVEKLLKLDPKNTTLLTQKQKLLSDAIKGTKEKLEQLNKVKELADKDTNVDKNAKEYRELERQIEQARQKLNDYQDQMTKMGGTFDDTNKKIKDTGKSALDLGDIIKGNLISDAIVSGLKAVGNAIVDISKSMYETVRDSGKLADDINTLAKQYNLSTKEIQVFMKASDLVDVELSTITKSFNKLTKNMTSTSKETQGAFKKLKITLKDNNGELRNSNDVFYETIDALSKVTNETEQDNLAMQIFGKSASDLGTLINGGTEELKEFNKYLEENNLLLSQDELDNLNEMNDSFDILSATFDSVKQKIASELAPVITPLVEQITKFIIDHKQDIIDGVKTTVEWLTGEEGKQMFEDIENAVSDVFDFFGKWKVDAPQLKEDLSKLADSLVTIAGVINDIAKAIHYILNPRENAQRLKEEYPWLYDDFSIGSLSSLFNSGGYSHGSGGGRVFSGGFGALQSGGYNITLNASFTANGNLDESQALRFADLMTERINDNLGGMV